jgi:hypothetical protein
MYATPSKPMLQSETRMRQIIQIEGDNESYYAVIMVGVMWLPDIKVLEPNSLRCIVAKIDGMDGNLIDGEPLTNILLIDK